MVRIPDHVFGNIKFHGHLPLTEFGMVQMVLIDFHPREEMRRKAEPANKDFEFTGCLQSKQKLIFVHLCVALGKVNPKRTQRYKNKRLLFVRLYKKRIKKSACLKADAGCSIVHRFFTLSVPADQFRVMVRTACFTPQAEVILLLRLHEVLLSGIQDPNSYPIQYCRLQY